MIPERYLNQSVSHGTMRLEDLIPKFLDLLQELNPAQAQQVTSGDDPNDLLVLADLRVDGSGTINPDLQTEANELLEWLFKELDSCAPDGYYFGSHPGDGSDYGFWAE